MTPQSGPELSASCIMLLAPEGLGLITQVKRTRTRASGAQLQCERIDVRDMPDPQASYRRCKICLKYKVFKRSTNRKQYKNRKARLWFLKGHRCAFCGMSARFINQLTIDHLIPLSRGGARDDFNLLLACETCNQKKGNDVIVPMSALVVFGPNLKVARKVRYRGLRPAWLI